jgi:hypothetical protein
MKRFTDEVEPTDPLNTLNQGEAPFRRSVQLFLSQHSEDLDLVPQTLPVIPEEMEVGGPSTHEWNFSQKMSRHLRSGQYGEVAVMLSQIPESAGPAAATAATALLRRHADFLQAQSEITAGTSDQMEL